MNLALADCAGCEERDPPAPGDVARAGHRLRQYPQAINLSAGVERHYARRFVVSR